MCYYEGKLQYKMSVNLSGAGLSSILEFIFQIKFKKTSTKQMSKSEFDGFCLKAFGLFLV